MESINQNSGITHRLILLILFLSFSCSDTANLELHDWVSTVAGNGKKGYLDGAGSGAEFSSPEGLAVDAQGNIYIADTGNNRIRVIRAGKLVSTLAGDGTAGFADGPGVSAQFNAPQSVAVDGDGNVYVSDTFNYRIRKISPSGQVTTLAGDGQSGYLDASGTNAEFTNPQAIAVDSQKNVYVADISRIRKITPAGMVSTISYDGLFSAAFGIAVDLSGNIYISDYGNSRILKVSPLGAISTVAGSGTAGYLNGAGSVAEFEMQTGIAVDAQGNLYVSEYNDIRKIAPDGTVSSFAGLGGLTHGGYEDGPVKSAKFQSPQGIATDGQGNLFVADAGNNYIREIVR